MGLYILGAFVAAAWVFIIYEVLTCPEVKENEMMAKKLGFNKW